MNKNKCGFKNIIFSQIITIKMRLKTKQTNIKKNKQENMLIKIITINNN